MSLDQNDAPSAEQACTLIHELIDLQATLQPAATAIWWQDAATDYATLHQRIQRVAGRIAGHGETGDRIAVLSWNCPEFMELIYGVSAAGRILVPLNARLAPAELMYQLTLSGATTLFADPELMGPLQQRRDFPQRLRTVSLGSPFAEWRDTGPLVAMPVIKANDPAWILFTSGSTGRPRGAVLTHQSFMAGLRSAALARPVERGDRYFYPFPLFHVAAHNVLLQHQYGAAVVLARSFDAQSTLEACRELQVTTLSLAPTMIAMLFDDPGFTPRDLNSVRTIGYGASAMPLTLLQKLQRETSVGLCQSYGMTELSGSVAFLTVQDHLLAARDRPELLRSVGRPLPTASIKLLSDKGVECATGEAGEILVKAEQCMDRYWLDPDATSAAIADGWLHTGDIGRFDAEGYLFIVDRKKDMIISGGENVASREVEEALRQHRAVRDCAVIGLANAQWGESVCAVVRLSADISDEELSAHCRTLIAGYKTPRQWFRVNELPLNASGKIDKPLLRKQYAPAT